MLASLFVYLSMTNSLGCYSIHLPLMPLPWSISTSCRHNGHPQKLVDDYGTLRSYFTNSTKQNEISQYVHA
ncbi:hypothetical protein EDD21DRAFT_365050 [Dissophora ornata]|nr:hypothetical protein EDD21DRAFT_365050 [Dissophora ornata]